MKQSLAKWGLGLAVAPLVMGISAVADCGKFSCIEIINIRQISAKEAEVVAITTGPVGRVQMTSGGHWGTEAKKIGPNMWKARFFSRPGQKKSARTIVRSRPDAYDTE
jgi:hypothetical protein